MQFRNSIMQFFYCIMAQNGNPIILIYRHITHSFITKEKAATIVAAFRYICVHTHKFGTRCYAMEERISRIVFTFTKLVVLR